MNPEVLTMQTPTLSLPSRRRRGSMKIEAGSLGIGGLIGAIIAAIVSIVASYNKARTAIKTHEIDDRGRVTADSNKLLEQTIARLTSVESTVKHLQNREAIFILAISNMGGELRVLNGFLQMHLLELKSENLDRETLIGQAELMSEAMTRIRSSLDSNNALLTQDFTKPTP